MKKIIKFGIKWGRDPTGHQSGLGEKYYIAHVSSNVTSYKYLFVCEKQPQSIGYQALFRKSSLLLVNKSGVWIEYVSLKLRDV